MTKNFARLEAPRFAPKPDQFEDDSFELRETKEARRRNATPKPEPQKIDVLAATFTVNRAAKRMRNASQAHYVGRRHGLAGHNRRRKEELYELKDRGIAACVVAGRLKWIGTHGGLAVYRGEGYCFHSTLIPRPCASVRQRAENRIIGKLAKALRKLFR